MLFKKLINLVKDYDKYMKNLIKEVLNSLKNE